MDFSFVLPRNNKELLEDGDCRNYFVKQVYTANEIPTLLRNGHQALQAGDAFFIFDHFDTFFSVIENVSQLQISNLVRAVELLYRTAENLGHMLDAYLKQETLDRQNDFLNLTKMVMYLLVSSVKAVDVFVKNHFERTNAPTGRKNKKNVDDELPQYINYEKKRYEILIQVCNIMQLPIEKLWNMSIVDEEFVNLLCGLAYRSLSLPSNKEKRVNDATFQILGIAIKQYRHGMAFPVQIVEIMDREEAAVVPIARGVRYLIDEFGIKSLLGNLLKELIDKINTNPSSQTTSKNLSAFLVDIGEFSPELSLQCIELAQDLLNLEPYAVRNSLFSIMSTVITKLLNGEDLNEEQRTLRDDCLEDLWNHMNDVSSYVRAKVLHIWTELKTADAIPLAWILRVLNRGIERLEDKTATVRKNAITLLKSFLESDPFASNLCADEVQEKLKIEEEKSRIIREKNTEQDKIRDEVNEDFQQRCTPPLTDILTNLLSSDEKLTNGSNHQTEGEENVEKVRDYLRRGEFETVARYIIKLDVCNEELRNTMSISEQVLYFIVLLNSYLFDDYSTEIQQLDGIIGFLQDALTFSEAMVQAVPKLEEMLMSTTTSDVLEAIEFFKTGYLFNIKGTEVGMRSMVRLLYISAGNDKNEKGEAVIKAYHSVLFGTDSIGRAHHIKVVDNLYNFIQRITTGEYTAFELMIKHWVLTDEINIGIINVMFERFTLKLPETSSSLARCCMELLILVSNAKPAVALGNRKLITDIISSRRILEDPRIFAGCLQLPINSIQPTTGTGDKNTKTSTYYKRYDDKEVIDFITSNFKQFFFYPNLPDFELIASQTINFLYKMCNAPDLLCQEIIYEICSKLNEISQRRAERMMDTSEDAVQSSQVTEMYIPDYLLPRIIFIFGYIASKEIVYLDNDVYLNMKYREELKREKKEQSNTKNKRKTVNLNASASEALKRMSTVNASPSEEAPEQDEAYMGATAEDTLAETINSICENELIGSADGLLYHLVPILIEILSQPAKYQDQHVQRAAVLTLMRFMAVSSHLCADRIAFLMNILKKTKSASMKCNIIVGLADLTSRFANTIEPWVPNFYIMLHETDETVRLAAMKMLSYVILQAIVRVTGQISDMASCVVDDNPDIRNAAKEFFRQLIASKEMEYYKILPDIVSRLSPSQSPIAEDKFRIIMKHLLELIQKDRQVESLVDKLCGRFRNTNTERQWRDIAYCLSLLNHSEKTLRKLIEHLPNYKDKVQYDEIYDCFKTIISNANKQILKVEVKLLGKELDEKLKACLEVEENGETPANKDGADAEDDENTAQSSQPAKKEKKKPAAKPSKQRRLDRLAHAMSSDDDDDFAENSPPARGKSKTKNAPATSTRAVRGRRGQAANQSDECSEEEPQPTRGRRGRR